MYINSKGTAQYSWNIDLSQYTNTIGCNLGAGIKYHIHSYWANETATSSSVCGSAFTGTQNHYDPYLACSPSSQSINTLCPALNRTATSSPPYNYNCSSGLYALGHVALCEVGDLSGKFGMMKGSGNVFSGSIENDPIAANPRYFQNSDYISLPWASLVLHCPVTGNPRLVCAKLVPTSVSSFGDDDDSDDSLSESVMQWQIVSYTFIALTIMFVIITTYLCCWGTSRKLIKADKDNTIMNPIVQPGSLNNDKLAP